MSPDDLLRKLIDSTDSFESALADPAIGEADIIAPFLAGLQSNEALDNAERERRLRIVFSRTIPTTPHFIAAATTAASLLNPILKNAVIQLLPPDFRGLVFKRSPTVKFEASQSLKQEVAAAQSEDYSKQPASEADGRSDFSDVIILSINDDPATKRLLEGSHFTPLRCQSVEDLDLMLATNESICAFLLEASFLRALALDQQLSLITKLALFSTFVWLRVQEDGISMDNVEIENHVAAKRCRPSGLGFTALALRDRPGLQERELSALNAARRRLTSGGPQGLFTPGELSWLEFRLLAAAMSDYAKERQFNRHAELTQVTATFLHGGHSGARVALVKINDFRVPLIVKIAKKEFILDEVRRFLTFIFKDNPELKPDPHFHGSAALIVFGIIPSSGVEHEQPAPTLESRLSDFWYGEMWSATKMVSDDPLVQGFKQATQRLFLLNRQPCSTRDFECKANPYLKSLKQMESDGFDWGFSKTILEKRNSAEEIIKTADDIAICHGDAHTRNVLIRGEEGFLIDYANSGPGHPCSDLVRLESAIYFSRFTPFGGEAELIQLQRDFSFGRLPFNTILNKYPGLFKSKTNQLALKLCVLARDYAGQVLAAHKLGWEHYLAVKLLNAWQSLQVPMLQQSQVRGVIASLSS